MKTVWGFDLGVGSIGSSIVTVNDSGDPQKIIYMGSRIIPLSVDERDEFNSGNNISKNAQRTQRRTLRKGYDRYQMRRATLLTALREQGMQPDETCLKLDKLNLWSLRSRAVSEQVSLPELGRVLLHLNQKRGYKFVRTKNNTKEDTDYVKTVNGRYEALRERGVTIGQYLYGQLQCDSSFRIKDLVYPRAAYVEEFDRIMAAQRVYYPEVLTDSWMRQLRDGIIYRQRPLKSCKGLVAVCEFEGCKRMVRGREVLCGPKVAPRTSPLAQECRIWEQVNNIRITDKAGLLLVLSHEQKEKVARCLSTTAKLTWIQLRTLLGLKKNDGHIPDKKLEKNGLIGNETYAGMAEIFGDSPVPNGLLDFPLAEIGSASVPALIYNHATGEVLCEEPALSIAPDVEQTPLYRLWHAIYSISDMEECVSVLTAKFGIAPDVAAKLAAIDLRRQGFSNKSTRAMRKILPYLRRGYGYSDAMELAGYNHSRSETLEQRKARPLKDRLDLLPKNALRQPVVEKVLNQLINLSNALIDKYGRPDEIRIELGRELKQSKEEREKAAKRMSAHERENKKLAARIEADYPGVQATRRALQKYKLYNELAAIGGVCIYCGKPISLSEALTDDLLEVEHIIPRSLLFDDAMSNKTLSHQLCNRRKGNRTAIDYMKAQTAPEYEAYLERVELLCKNDRTKRKKLLMSEGKIPTNFIDRQLRQSQCVARKVVEILSDVCSDVWTTSGSVTAYLRRIWGWEDVLMNLRLQQYRDIEGAVEWVEYQRDGKWHRTERIVGWSQRNDLRHHAIDALTIACTQQGYIRRLNTLSREKTRADMMQALADPAQGRTRTEKVSLLERYIAAQRPFTPAEVMANTAGILVSFKPGKRVATSGVRKAGPYKSRRVVQQVLVPRGPLSEESVYGRISAEGGKNAYVIRYKLDANFNKVDKMVDPGLRAIVQARLDEFGGKAKDAFREPVLWNGQPIRSVRCYTGLSESSVEPVRYDPQSGEPIGFVKPGNNHHIAFYLDQAGSRQYQICTFWHAVERKRLGLPVIVRQPGEVWDVVQAERSAFSAGFLEKLPLLDWQYEFSLQQNEMVLLGLPTDIASVAITQGDTELLSKHLYRLQRIGTTGYKLVFRHHLASTINNDTEMVGISSFSGFAPIKVRVDMLGRISLCEIP